jgi:malate dehydrogenase (oxaloacetate-decarboxylating)
MDEFGLVVEGISPDEYKKPIMQFADTYRDWNIESEIPTLLEVIKNAKPTALLGLTGVSGLFNQEVIEAMASQSKTPIIFPLSNPTSNVEAIPADILKWCDNKDNSAIIASGSPFPDVIIKGNTHVIGQGNNAFIFPGLGFASMLGESKEITDSMIIEAAYALADYTAKYYLEDKRIYPPISDLQAVSKEITERVLKLMIDEKLVTNTELNLSNYKYMINESVWKAEYLPFVAS